VTAVRPDRTIRDEIEPRPPWKALTSDAWYTLLWVSAREHRGIDARRRAVWTSPLIRGGLSRAPALRRLRELDQWKRHEESRGRTPPLAVQARWLGHRTGVRFDIPGLETELDRALLRARVRRADGAREALRELGDRGLALGIVSNVLNETGRAARTILDRLGFLPLVRTVVLSCEQPWAKPRPEPFRLAAQFLRARPQDTAHVGDLAYDVVGARRAGFTPLLFRGLARYNRYLPGQPGTGMIRSTTVVRRWADVVRRVATP
jgi:FMN phosphatase YigB (HAD superfamily)